MGLPVYLVHWHAPEWCQSAVASLLASEAVDLSVVVVNNGGEVDLPAQVRVIDAQANAGYAGGANIALEDWLAGDGEWCVIGSHDLHVAPDALATMIATGDRYPDVGIVAPDIDGWRPTRSREEMVAPGVVEVDWSSGTCLMIRRPCALKTGPFDGAFGSYVEDVDYGLRARQAGWRTIIVLDAHAKGRGTAHGKTASYLVSGNTIYLVAKHEGLLAGGRQLLRAIYIALRAVLGALAPWRPRQDRATSRFYAQAYGRGSMRATRLLATLLGRRIIRRSTSGSARWRGSPP
jgi:GT2 family glycosyltransferase